MKDTLHAMDHERSRIADGANDAFDPEEVIAVSRDDRAEPRCQLKPFDRTLFFYKPGAGVCAVVVAMAD